jgi:hypothetical protein
MANRHSNKRLRNAVRARMAATGESYQQALSQLRVQRAETTDCVERRAIARDVECASAELIEVNMFSQPAVIAVVSTIVGQTEATTVGVSMSGVGWSWMSRAHGSSMALSGLFRVRRAGRP